MAARFNKIKVIPFFLRNNADIEYSPVDDVNSALFMAIRYKHPNILYPLHLICEGIEYEPELTKVGYLLLAYGANPNLLWGNAKPRIHLESHSSTRSFRFILKQAENLYDNLEVLKQVNPEATLKDVSGYDMVMSMIKEGIAEGSSLLATAYCDLFSANNSSSSDNNESEESEDESLSFTAS